MKITPTLDLVIQIETLRSIEVKAQGCYYLKFEAFFSTSNGTKSAVPYNIILGGQRSASILAPSSIDNQIYNSQIFMVKFFDEIIALNEICFFRIDDDVTNEDFEVTLLCKLLCFQCFSFTGPEVFENVSHNKDFSVTVEKEFLIKNPNRGFHQYLPVYLSQGSCLLTNLSVHSFLSGYTLDRETETFPTHSKIKFRDLENQAFRRAVSLKFFQDSEKVSKRQIFKVYEKVVVKFLVFYEKTRLFLLQFWDSQDLGGCARRLLDLSGEIEKFQISSEEIFSQTNEFFMFVTAEESAKIIGRGLWSISKNLSYLQDFFIKTMQFRSCRLIKYLMHLFNMAYSQVFTSRKMRTRLICSSFEEAPSEDYSLRHSFVTTLSENLSKNPEIKDLFVFPRPQPDDKEFPFIFVDILSKSDENWSHSLLSIQSISKVRKNAHLVVLVHGLYGSSHDMLVLRNLISKYFPCTSVLCSFYNEQKTEGSICKMGKRLADEIKKFLADNFYSDSLQTMSFIGYSLGGLIIRSALKHLSDFHSRLHFFITLSTPHLGCSISSSKLVKAGIWIIKKLKRCKSLAQLSLSDSNHARSSFIYTLSQSPEIQHFRHLAFVSSCQDKYSPISSSLCLVKTVSLNASKPAKSCKGSKSCGSFKGSDFLGSSKVSKEVLQSEIASNILRLVSAQELLRIDAKFEIEGKGLDRVLGRAAHIEMIDNPHFLELLLHECCHFLAEF